MISLRSLTRLPYVWDYDVSPDGRLAAFVWDRSGQLELYLLRLDGAGPSEPWRITGGPESKMAPRFSPDGTRLAYAQDYGGNECYDLFIYDLRTGATRNLTPDTPRELINPDVTWSPDGRYLAYQTDRAGEFATHVLSVEAPSAPRRLTRHPYSDHTAAWSPDGRVVAVSALAQGQENWLFLLTPDGDQLSIVEAEGRPIDAYAPAWSPDGRRLAFVSSAPGASAIFTYDLASRALRQETPADREADEPEWSPDGACLAYTWNEDGNASLRIKVLGSGKISALRLGPGVHAHPHFASRNRLLALFSSAQQPSDLWAFPLGEKEPAARPRQITYARPDHSNGHSFVNPRAVRWPSDGLSIPGLLYTPPGFQRGRDAGPAVLYVHGGPNWQYSNDWYVLVQYLVSCGCVVLAPNYRGSTGYGRAFQEASRFDFGGGDMRDVIAAAEFLVREGYAAPGRLAITGASYGGYLTMTALTRYPRMFAAGSAVVPYLNWFTAHDNVRGDLQYWDLLNFGDPVHDAERYRALSPIFYMDNIVAPVQLIAAANDQCCPASETEQAVEALRGLDVPHEVVIYPDEGHFFRKLETRVDADTRRARFLLKYLTA
jgi:dipeptidyl aminopeptidase/acylaminoacyl peptidase